MKLCFQMPVINAIAVVWVWYTLINIFSILLL